MSSRHSSSHQATPWVPGAGTELQAPTGTAHGQSIHQQAQSPQSLQRLQPLHACIWAASGCPGHPESLVELSPASWGL